jgi:hypothetical protein
MRKLSLGFLLELSLGFLLGSMSSAFVREGLLGAAIVSVLASALYLGLEVNKHREEEKLAALYD